MLHKVVTFTSWRKGGVGKSLIAANLAVLINARVAIVDMGLSEGALASFLHGATKWSHGLYDYLIADSDEVDVLKSSESRNTILIPPGNVELTTINDKLADISVKLLIRKLLNLFDQLVEDYGVDIIIVDMPVAFNEKLAMATYSASDVVNVVITPAEDSVRNGVLAYRHVLRANADAVINCVANQVMYSAERMMRLAYELTNKGEPLVMPFDPLAKRLNDERKELFAKYDTFLRGYLLELARIIVLALARKAGLHVLSK